MVDQNSVAPYGLQECNHLKPDYHSLQWLSGFFHALSHLYHRHVIAISLNQWRSCVTRFIRPVLPVCLCHQNIIG